MAPHYDSIFSTDNYSYANQKYRGMDEHVFASYYNCICNRILPDRIENILDVCCGTGQFAVNLAKLLPKSNTVALDSSPTQLAKLNSIIHAQKINNIRPIESRFECFRSVDKFDLITCSEAVHLFSDFSGFARKVSQLIKPNGIICIRTPSPAQFMERNIYDFFPTCRYLNLVNCKGPELIEATFSLYGLHILDTCIVDESKMYEKEELLEAFRLKMFSTLSLIPSEEFDKGILRLEQALKNSDKFYYDFHMTCYLLGKKEFAFRKK